MKSWTVSSILFVFLFNQIAGAAGLCEALFPEAKAAKIVADAAPKKVIAEKFKIKVATDSDRTEMYKINDEGFHSRLKIEVKELSKDSDQAVLELMRLLVDGTTYALEDKNVLLKNKMSLGIRLNNGFTFLVNYESKSSTRPWFVVEDKILLLSPTNKEIKITDGIVDPISLKIAKSEFDMPDFFEKDSQVVLKIPLSVEPEVLKKLDSYAPLFEHMPKEKLRKILAINSTFKRKAMLQLERAKSMFKKEIMKQPFKILLHGTIMGLISFGVNQAVSTNGTDVFKHMNDKPAAVVEAATLTASFSANEALAKAQYSELRKQIQQTAQEQHTTAGAEKSKDIIVAGGTSFTVNAKTFIFEQADPMNGSIHTYIVFAEDKVIKNEPALQYFATEINAAKYAPMIQAIKSHQQID